MIHFPSLLRECRKKQRRTLANVSERTGISVSFLSEIERGKTDPSLSTLIKLLRVYNYELSVETIIVLDGL